MASELTLDSIRAAAEKKYGSRVLDLGDGKSITLKNPLKLSKENREALGKLELDSEGEPLDYFIEAFTLVASAEETKDLREVLGDDVTLYMTLFEEYMGSVELGEASPSQD